MNKIFRSIVGLLTLGMAFAAKAQNVIPVNRCGTMTVLQAALAKRTAGNLPSNGIERIVTAQSVFGIGNTSIKYTASGGADAWDPTRFFNVWVCRLTDGLLGYATFPTQTPTREQGVVMSYGT